jgi:DNA-directed RNA polymerase specialized sigma24 family protein
MSYVEIAEVLGIPESTVKIRSHRARLKIRKILAPYLEDLSK